MSTVKELTDYLVMLDRGDVGPALTVRELLDAFEKDAIARRKSGKKIDHDWITSWFATKGVQPDPLVLYFLGTVAEEGFTSSDYADDAPTKYGLTYDTWKGYRKNKGLPVLYESKKAYFESLKLFEVYEYYQHIASEAFQPNDSYAIANSLDIRWAGTKRVKDAKRVLKDAGLTEFDPKTLKALAAETARIRGYDAKSQRALIFSARLETYLSKIFQDGKTAPGTAEDHYYRGLFRRVLDKKWLGEDFDFNQFPPLRDMVALANAGKNWKFKNESSWKTIFQSTSKPFQGRKGILSDLTPLQQDQILSVKV